MKKNYLLPFLFAFLISTISFGQTTLTAGDLVVIEMQGDSPDGFRFVPLVDLAAGTIIKFTDNGYTGTAIRSGEGTVTYTVPSGGVLAGTNIRYTVGDGGDFSASPDVNIASGGDQILVYQGDASSPTFIFAAAGNSNQWQTGSNDSNQSDLPAGLTDGVNAVAAGAGPGPEDEFDNIYYSGITTGTKTELLAAVANAGNWVGNNSSSSPITANFTVNPETSDPTISFITPSNNQVFPSTTAQVPISFNVNNFTLSGNNGSDMSDGTGDGFIKGTATRNGSPDGTVNIFSTSGLPFDVDPGDEIQLVAELVDNSGNSLSPAVSATVTFSVEWPCDLELGAITNICNALTPNADTYNSTIAFTGGGTADYTITALDGNNNPVGTVGGDDPSSEATGTITITGIPEGVDVTLNVLGDDESSCDIDRTLFSPVCIDFPIEESFAYTVGQNLTDQPSWTELFSGDDILIATGTIANPFSPQQFPDPTGEMVSFDGTGKEAYLEYNQRDSGTIFASFLFTVTDISMQQANGGYFAILAEAGGSYRTRIWVKPNASDNTKYEVGVSVGSGSAVYDGIQHTPGEEIFVVVSHNFADDTASLWVDPDPTTFSQTPPTATQTQVASGNDIPDNLGRFILRQDDGDETPPINFDELRIGTTWSHVTPEGTTASVGDNPIAGFTAFPNPVINKQLTITSQSSDAKEVQLYNILGKQVFAQSFRGTRETVELHGVRPGLYILKVIEGSKVSTSKLVVE